MTDANHYHVRNVQVRNESWLDRNRLFIRCQGERLDKCRCLINGGQAGTEAAILAAELNDSLGGSIILTSSVANVRGDSAFTAYAASKAAVRCFARGWTVELKDRKIRVNSVSPRPIETPALEKAGLTAEQVEQVAAQFASQVPLGRRGKPEEIAATVVFLASDESSYITGVDLAVDGGMVQVCPRCVVKLS